MRLNRREWIAILLVALLLGFSQTAHGQTWQDYIDEGTQRYNRSDFRGALEVWQRGLELTRETASPQAVAVLLTNMGNVCFSLSDYSRALSSYEEALEIARNISYRMAEGYNLTNIGNVYSYLDDYPSALSFYEQSLEITRGIGDRGAEGQTLTAIGVVYVKLADYPRALSFHEEALEITREIGDRRVEGLIRSNIGGVYLNLSDYPRALSFYEEALEIRRAIGNRKGEGESLNHMGNVYLRLGNYPRALSFYEEALEITREVGDRRVEGHALNNLGVVYQELADYPRALSYYEEALEITRNISYRLVEGKILNNMGGVHENLADYPRALSFYEEALEIVTEIGAKRVIGQFAANIGNVYLELGRLDEALEIFQELSSSLHLGKYYLVTGEYSKAQEQFTKFLETAEKQRTAESLLTRYIGLGLALEGLRNYAGSKDYYRKAIDFMERQRESLTESQRKHFFAGKVQGFSRIEPYEGLARVSLKISQAGNCFLYCEHAKSRLFLDVIARRYGGGMQNIPKELSKQEEELTNKIASLYKQQEIAFEKDNQQRLREIEKELEPLKEEQTRFIESLRQTYPEYASLKYPQPIGAGEVALQDDELLLEYEVTESETIALLLERGKILSAISIPITRDSMTELVKKYRGFTEGIQYASDLRRYDPELGTQLYELLVQDLIPLLDKAKKLIIVPDEILCILPFEMLISELPPEAEIVNTEFGPCLKGLRYLGDDYQISYYQSATSLTTIRSLSKASAAKPLFALADPIFDTTDTRLTGEVSLERSSEYLAMVTQGVREAWRKDTDSKGAVFPRLEKTGQVAERLRQSFGKGTTVLTGSLASEKQLRQQNLDEYGYLLFATHGILDNTVPYIQEPALVLTQVDYKEEEGLISSILSSIWQLIRSILVGLGLMDEAPEELTDYEDPSPGFLTLSEVMNMRIASDVVALTACNTGLGRNLTGEGVMGLGRAFQYAGARAVLMSLWSVEEKSTNILTESFFGYLKDGKGKLEALRLAREDVREAGYEHPYYWAPFILVGET